MKKCFLVMLGVAALTAFGSVQHQWMSETSEISSESVTAYHGETVELMCKMTSYGKTLPSCRSDAVFMWQTNGMDTVWWQTNATFSAGVVKTYWTPFFDCGANEYRFFFLVTDTKGSNYRANGTIELLGSPYGDATFIPPPLKVIDFATVKVENPDLAPFVVKCIDFVTPEMVTNIANDRVEDKVADWALKPNPAPVTDLTQATNYTDSVGRSIATSSTNYADAVGSAVGTASTNYTDACGLALAVSATNYANSVSFAGTNYTDTVGLAVGTAATNYADSVVGHARQKDDCCVYRKVKDCWMWKNWPNEDATTNAPADFLAYANSPSALPLYFHGDEWFGANQYWPNGKLKYDGGYGPSGEEGVLSTNLNFKFTAYAEDGRTTLFRFGATATRTDPTNETLVNWSDSTINQSIRIATTDIVNFGLDGKVGTNEFAEAVNAVGTASTNYTDACGLALAVSATNYANSVSFAGTNYTEAVGFAVGTASTNYTDAVGSAVGTAATNYVNASISATNTTFSSAVLSVGLDIDSDTLEWLKDIGAIAGSTTGKVGIGTLLAALHAALMWLNKNKLNTSDVVYPDEDADEGDAAEAKGVVTFVNSSINAMAAFFLAKDDGTAFQSNAELVACTSFKRDGKTGQTPTQNDYTIVIRDETHPIYQEGVYAVYSKWTSTADYIEYWVDVATGTETVKTLVTSANKDTLGIVVGGERPTVPYTRIIPTSRYSYQGKWEEQHSGGWQFQYSFNTSGFTAAQLAALNSGVSEQLLADIGEELSQKANAADLTSHINNGMIHVTSNEKTAWNAKQDALTQTQLGYINDVPNKADRSDTYTKSETDAAIVEKGTAPDAHLEAPTDEQLKLILADNSVAYDSTKALPYKLASAIADRTMAHITLTAESTDITLPSVTTTDTTVKDFILEVTNAYEVEGVATDAGVNIPRTDFKLVCRDGDSISDVTKIKAGKSAFLCFTQKSPVTVDGTSYPCWFVTKVELGDPS